MTTFQWITVPMLIVAGLFTAVATSRRRIAPGVGAAWILLWLAAAYSIAYPEILATLARLLGIGRGADLVMYVSILMTFIGFFLMYLRYRRLNDKLTEIVRQIAIQNARKPDV